MSASPRSHRHDVRDEAQQRYIESSNNRVRGLPVHFHRTHSVFESSRSHRPNFGDEAQEYHLEIMHTEV